MTLMRDFAVGSALLLCAAAAAAWLPATEALGWIVARAGGGLAVAFGLALGLGLILETSARVVQQSNQRSDRLRHQMAMAEARAVSYFADEALAGAIALGDLGRRVELERQALRGRARMLLLGSFATLAAAVTTTCCGIENGRSQTGLAMALFGAFSAAACLIRAALAIARMARALEPDGAQVRAALVRHHARLEAERLAMRPNLAALAGAIMAEAAPSRTKAA